MMHSLCEGVLRCVLSRDHVVWCLERQRWLVLDEFLSYGGDLETCRVTIVATLCKDLGHMCASHSTYFL